MSSKFASSNSLLGFGFDVNVLLMIFRLWLMRLCERGIRPAFRLCLPLMCVSISLVVVAECYVFFFLVPCFSILSLCVC